MKRTLLICCIPIFLLQINVNLSQAQPYSPEAYDYEGDLNIVVTNGIDDLIGRHIIANQQKQLKFRGYRIQISQDQNGALIRDHKAAIKRMYPDLATYETYDSPLFRLRVGNFENRFEAYGVFHQLKKIFNTAFIVEDAILRE